MATEVLNSGRTDKVKKNRRNKSRNRAQDEEEPLSPRDEMKNETKAAFDEFLKDALTKSQDSEGKSKKKKKRVDEQVLERLRKGDGLRKEKDQLLDANTFDPDDTKTGKSNKRRQKERDKNVTGTENLAFDKDEIVTTTTKKGKKKTEKDDTYIDRDMSVSELKTSTATKDKTNKKKSKSKTEETVLSEGDLTEDNLSPPTSGRGKKKGKKKKTLESEIEEYQEHLMHQEEMQSEANDTLQGADSENLLSHEDEDEPDTTTRKKKKKKKQKSTAAAAEPEEAAETDAAAKAAEEPEAAVRPPTPIPVEDEGRILGLTIHRTDKLKTNFWMAHPLVRVSMVDLDTGNYVKKQVKDRNVTSYFENERDNVDFVLPMMTQPFDFKQNKSTLPLWEEMLILNENFNHFLQEKPNVMIFFELMDFVTMTAASQKYTTLKSEGGWHRIAWGFLKFLGAHGRPNTDRKVRLQLYQPPTRYRKKPDSVEVYQWWKSNLRAAYPSTIYVTAKGIIPPEKVEPSARSMFATQQEKGRETFDDLEKSLNRSGAFSVRGQETGRQKGPSLWSRLAGQMCKIPNCLSLTLPAGRYGCFCVKFSHDGKSLACAGHDKEGYCIYIYEVPSGKLRGKISAHFSLIYELDWSRGDTHLISASADGTARVWDTKTISNTAVKTLPHPAFVYTAKFHPKVAKIIVTGGYDRIVRVWTVQGEDLHGQLLLELDNHASFVNSVCFDDEGKALYSADSLGMIWIWNVFVTDKGNGLLHEWTQNKKIDDNDLRGVCISNIRVHPNGRRLLVHCRDNSIKMIDLRIGAIMQRYIGALNFREHVRSTMSPCGTFVAAGSEDACAYVWNTETGDQVAMYNDLGYKSAVCDVDYHAHDHMMAFCSFSENSPVLVYMYDHRVAQRDAGMDVGTTDDDLRRRARSPDLRHGYDGKSDDEGLEVSTQVAQMHSMREDSRLSDLGRLEMVTRKLEAVSAFKSGTRARSPDLPHSMPRAASPGITWGTTFDSTGMYSQRSNRARSPEPAMFSPHSSRPTTAAIEHQQHFSAQSQYMGQGGWRPGFSEISRTGSLHRSPMQYGRNSASINLTASQQGKAQFTFQGKNKRSETDTYNKSQAASRASPVQLLPEDVLLTGPGMYMVPPGYYATPMEMYGGPSDGIAGVHDNRMHMVTNADVHHSSHSRRVQFKTRQVIALYDYQAARSDELSFVRGEEISVLYKDNDMWWMGELGNGQQGFFPANYVAGYGDQTEMPDILPEYTPKSKRVDNSADESRSKKTTAVKMRSGELKFFSGTEDSDVEASARSRKKSNTRKSSRDTMSLENEEIPMSTARRNHRRSRIQETTA